MRAGSACLPRNAATSCSVSSTIGAQKPATAASTKCSKKPPPVRARLLERKRHRSGGITGPFAQSLIGSVGGIRQRFGMRSSGVVWLNRNEAKPRAPDSRAAGVPPRPRRSAHKSRAPSRSRRRARACACQGGRREPAKSGNKREPAATRRHEARDRASNRAARLAFQSAAATGARLRYERQPALGPTPVELQPPSVLLSSSREQTVTGPPARS